MIANQFFDSLNKFQWNTYVGVNDFVDKLNFLFTVIVIIVCISVVTVRQFVLKPISCYLSTDIGGFNLLEYLENFCWVHGTIPVSYNGSIPSSEIEWQEMEKFKILYYQWVPFVLAIQCILFHIPRIIWTVICHNQAGTDIQHMIDSANQAIHSNEETRDKMTSYLAKSLEQMLFQYSDSNYERKSFFRHIFNNCSFCIAIRRMGYFIVLGYFNMKLLYIANAVGQLFLIKRFLGFDSFSFLGIQVLKNLINGKDWQITLIFPRVTFCYAKIRHFGSKYNGVMAQCVLPVNMLNEKIYIFLWHWILILTILNFISLFHWIKNICVMKQNSSFIRKFLFLNEKIKFYDYNQRKLVDIFTKSFLRHDGVFLLRMMSLNAGEIITGDIICHLWTSFNEKYQNQIPTNIATPSLSVPNGFVEPSRSSAPMELNPISEKDSAIV